MPLAPSDCARGGSLRCLVSAAVALAMSGSLPVATAGAEVRVSARTADTAQAPAVPGRQGAPGQNSNAPLAQGQRTDNSPTVDPPPDSPPVASLAVTQVASPPLTVVASGEGSTDPDSRPIASYSFDFGDGTPAVVTASPTLTA